MTRILLFSLFAATACAAPEPERMVRAYEPQQLTWRLPTLRPLTPSVTTEGGVIVSVEVIPHEPAVLWSRPRRPR